jgi:hypothetical protein
MTRSLVLALSLLAGGCATPGATGQSDTEKMSLVERTAAERGVKIYWVNPPNKTQAAAPAKQGS